MRPLAIVWIALIGSAASTCASFADSDGQGLGLTGFGATGVLARPGDLGSAVGFAIHADLGEIYPGLVLFPTLSYWGKSVDLVEGAPSLGKLQTKEIGLQANVHYYLNPEANVNYYLGSGVGLFSTRTTTTAEGITAGEPVRSATSFGISILGGLESPVSESSRFIGEILYKVDSETNVLRVSAGLSFYL